VLHALILLLGALAKLRKATVGFVGTVRLSVRMEQLGSHWVDFHEIWYLRILENLWTKFQVSLKSDNNNADFAWRLIYTFLCISLCSSQNEKCFRQKLLRKSKHTYYVWKRFLLKNHTIHEIMWKNIVEPDRPQITTWLMHIASWIPEAANTHPEYVILIAFPQQQWLHERVSMLRYTDSACLVDTCLITRETASFYSKRVQVLTSQTIPWIS
jgi:hypothetical protein